MFSGSCVKASRFVREALTALLLGWLAMMLVNTLLFQRHYADASPAAAVSQATNDPSITGSFIYPIYIWGVDPSIYKFGELHSQFYAKSERPGVEKFDVRLYRFGFPFHSLEYKLYTHIYIDGDTKGELSGAFMIQGKYVPLMPSGMDIVIPYGGFHRPIPYILNTLAWSIIAYAILVVNTRLRIQIHRERKRKSMKKQGRCVKCGYQMDGLEQCPECGQKQTQSSGAA